MTPQSAGIAMVIAAVIAVVTGLAFRGRRWQSDAAFAAASIAGLVFMRASKPSDLWQSFRPSVALDWLPWFILAAATIAVLTKPLSKLRWAIAAGFAIVVAARSLWQSIYARDLTSGPIGDHVITIVCIATWIVMLGAVMAASAESPTKPFRASVFWANVIAWAVSVGCTAIAIAMTGSLTYGAAVGTIAIAMVSTLLTTGSMPIVAAVPLMTLVGLSVAFSELPPAIAMLMGTCFVGLVMSSRWQRLDWPSMILALVATAIIIPGQLKTKETDTTGYGRTSPSPSPSPSPSSTLSPPPPTPIPTPSKTPPGKMPDPFGGIGLP